MVIFSLNVSLPLKVSLVVLFVYAPLLFGVQPASANMITFNWSGTLIDNAGIQVLGVNGVQAVSGTFSYNLDAQPSSSGADWSRYIDPMNIFTLEVNGFSFATLDPALVDVSDGALFQGFSNAGSEISVPIGWNANLNYSTAFGITLQAPPGGSAITSLDPPTSLDLSLFTSAKEVRLDFYNGLTYADLQGNNQTELTGRRMVYIDVTSINIVPEPLSVSLIGLGTLALFARHRAPGR